MVNSVGLHGHIKYSRGEKEVATKSGCQKEKKKKFELSIIPRKNLIHVILISCACAVRLCCLVTFLSTS